jgi:LDH2 family malate/lactate/ureidoglycolate dehydrogenase
LLNVPFFEPGPLSEFGVKILEANGVPPHVAEVVIHHAIASLLSGEENHGIELGTQYIPAVRAGRLQPTVEPRILKETASTMLVDGGYNFGHYVSHWTIERMIESVRRNQVSIASIRNQGHVGRLMDYTAMAAEAGFVAIMMTDGAFGRRSVAPYGGKDRRLGVNPFSMAVPSDLDGVLGFDMTSGAVSKTKIRMARQRGEPIPKGWLLDKDGRDTTDPDDFYRDGSVMPFGGDLAYKGYALIYMIEILADILAGMEFKENHEKIGYDDDHTRPTLVVDGALLIVFDVEAFRPLAEFTADVSEMTRYVKSSALAPGSAGIFYPGERSARNRAERLVSGVGIPDHCWTKIMGYADEAGLANPPAPIR